MANNNDRNTPEIAGILFSFPVKPDSIIPAGSIVQLDSSGLAQAGKAGSNLICVGRAEKRIEAKTDTHITVKRGVFCYKNAGDLTVADINGQCFVHDFETVSKAGTSPARSPCGTVLNVTAEGVWIRI